MYKFLPYVEMAPGAGILPWHSFCFLEKKGADSPKSTSCTNLVLNLGKCYSPKQGTMKYKDKITDLERGGDHKDSGSW